LVGRGGAEEENCPPPFHNADGGFGCDADVKGGGESSKGGPPKRSSTANIVDDEKARRRRQSEYMAKTDSAKCQRAFISSVF